MLKNKLILYGLIGALVLGLTIGIFAFRGKKAKFNKAKVDQKQIPNGWSPTLLAKQLYEAMEDITWSNDATELALEELNSLNDEQFKAVYNEFNKNHGNDSWFEKGSLRDWINDEYGLASSKIGFAILERMDRLNLT